MTVYVVTEGEYSDYHIVCVFLDKAKADNYAKYHQDGWGGCYVEEYEINDDKYECVKTGFHKISGEIVISKNGKVNDCHIYSGGYLVELPEDVANLSDYSWSSRRSDGDWMLQITRSFQEQNIHYEGEPMEKLTHILKDTAAMVADFRQQGYSIEDIRKMMGFEDE